MAEAENRLEYSPQMDTRAHSACLFPLVFQVDYWGLSHKGLNGWGVKLTFHLWFYSILIFNILQKKKEENIDYKNLPLNNKIGNVPTT